MDNVPQGSEKKLSSRVLVVVGAGLLLIIFGFFYSAHQLSFGYAIFAYYLFPIALIVFVVYTRRKYAHREKQLFQESVANAQNNLAAPPGVAPSSEDIHLSPKYASVRFDKRIVHFIVFSVILVVISYIAFIDGSSLVWLIAIFVAWSAVYFTMINLIIRTQEKNFYFRCDDSEIEITRGFLNRKHIIILYDQISDLEVWQERTNGRYGVSFNDLYDVLIKTNSLSHHYGGFLEADAQKIVDFILPRIKMANSA
jgi:membrane protein YdbS with pleckstrin-like domain